MNKSKEGKKKIHIHQWTIERAGFNPKTMIADYLDMICRCGGKLFVENPTIHYGDEPNMPYRVDVVQYEKSKTKKKK